MIRFADVILPLPLYSSFTYRIPEVIDDVKIGSRVLVPFGRKKYYTAIVIMVHHNEPKEYEVKEISALLDDTPIVRHPQLKFWAWISEYYLCSQGDVFKAAVPAGLKVESETVIAINPDYEDTDTCKLSERERIVYDLISSRDKVQLNEISGATGFRNVGALVSRMLDKGAVFVAEKVVDNYRPKTETLISLNLKHGDEAGLHRYFDMVHRSAKQEALLLAYLDLSRWLQSGEPREVKKEELMARADVSQAVLSGVIAKGVLRQYKKEINRFANRVMRVQEKPRLSDEQLRALNEIRESYKEKNITLLHGVTSSGKTSVYVHLIDEVLRKGRQALYLVPEIALTAQLTRRLQQFFGDKLIIYHSKFSDNERVDIWKKLLNSSEPCVVIGVRSAVFLPFADLGLVVVDEEHDTSYKQQDPAPRYNGRNAAIVLAQMHGAKTLLGSATPAIETYHNAETGRYGLVSLLSRYEDIEMPEVEVVDTKEARRKKEMNGMFSGRLIGLCRKSLDAGEQVILFQNRRGYAPMVRCKQCEWIPKCENCDVSLTYHKHVNSLSCHYCGYTIQLPSVCPACKMPALEIVGYGTERIEDEVETVFPGDKIARMDLDTTRNKNSYEKLIEDFSSRKMNILVGTQMVTKGLDFAGVSTVGILNADTMINFPDFRSDERAFDMMEQVSGRAGRKSKQGRVVIQTSDVSHPVIGFVKSHDYAGFYKYELGERQRFGYPPFTKIINIYLKHRDDSVLTEMSVRFSNMLREVFRHRVLGPEAPMVARVQNFYIRQIVLKMENEASMPKVKTILRKIYEDMLTVDSRMKSVILYYDVDPM
ncbi:MAG: primosomal protein N' [Muribaculaceae bacterium]|nr:primosomal protein N' [Muribaculaceae bacterium]